MKFMAIIATFVVVAVVVTTLIIYLTPLKNLRIIPPIVKDVSPSKIEPLLSENPDEYTFIDVRSPAEFSAEHAPGSYNVPLHLLFDAHLALPRSGKTIVLICSGGRASGVGYGFLENQGFLNLLRVEGGIEQWKKEGLPTETADR